MRHAISRVTSESCGLIAKPISSTAICSAVLGKQCRRSYTSVNPQPYQRLSQFWIPTQSSNARHDEKASTTRQQGTSDYAHTLLVQAGFLRQTHAGIFHMLPLGARVISKVESLLDRYMAALGASKTSLSTISSEQLWERSGRLGGKDSELFHFEDRKHSKFLLAPTHEEEITSIVAQSVHSYKDLPLRLYQITRKYRDEPRPRAGLLRGREFLMKDLYTFDATPTEALDTYEEVRTAYREMFAELKVPIMSAAADSGNIGGDISHEYHIASASGEDTIIHCVDCETSANEETVSKKQKHCPNCETGVLSEIKAIELGHTFHLGERYSQPLELRIRNKENKLVNVQMGCHGVGVSRLVAAIADVKADATGLNWPTAIAPFTVVVVPAKGATEAASEVSRQLSGGLTELSGEDNPTRTLDVALDDRDKAFGWKLGDADLIGYPVLVVVGNAYKESQKVEVQCRQLNIKENVLVNTHAGVQRIYDILKTL